MEHPKKIKVPDVRLLDKVLENRKDLNIKFANKLLKYQKAKNLEPYFFHYLEKQPKLRV